jgi:5-methylcytosine-specific restriction endonuclease McrA
MKTPEERKQRQAAWYAANREAVIARVRQRAIEKRDEVSAYKKRYAVENKERISAQRKAFREANLERLSAEKKKRYQVNKANIIAKVRRYNEANRARLAKLTKARWREWCLKYPEKRKESFARRRAWKRQTQAEKVDFKQVLRDAKGICGICRKPLDLFGTEFDHIVPLARGGTHTRANIQVAHARCNRAKGAKVA